MVYAISDLVKTGEIVSLYTKSTIDDEVDFGKTVFSNVTENNREFLIKYWLGEINRESALNAKGHHYSYVAKNYEGVVYHWLTNHFSYRFYPKVREKIYATIGRALKPTLSYSRAKSLFTFVDEVITSKRALFTFSLHAMMLTGFEKSSLLVDSSNIKEVDQMVVSMVDNGFWKFSPQLPTGRGYAMRKTGVKNFITAIRSYTSREMFQGFDVWQKDGISYYLSLVENHDKAGYVPFVSTAIAAYLTKILITKRYKVLLEPAYIQTYFERLGLTHYKLISFTQDFVRGKFQQFVELVRK